MSSLGVRTAIAHAAVNKDFREDFLTDPQAACQKAGYEVDESEVATIKENLSEDSFGTAMYSSENLTEVFQASQELADGFVPVVPMEAIGEDQEFF